MKSLLEMIEALLYEVEAEVQQMIDKILDQWYRMLPRWLYESIILSRAV